MYGKYIKRTCDLFIALISLVLLSPLLISILVVVKIDSPGPAIFKQKRLGLDGKSIMIYKFRTMYMGAEQGGVYSGKEDSRVTKTGQILRRYSLDELPQLFCVLAGTMSLIGPRPPLTYHPWSYADYTDEQKKIFEVRPGITGLAQISGRNAVTWDKRIEINVWYSQHLSLALDLWIFFSTFYVVLSHKNVFSE